MKKLSLIVLLIISNCYSQEINTDIREYISFKEGTTYFVKSNDSKYNKIVNDILIKYWTVNKFEMITSNQVEKLKGDSSFFVDQVEYSFSRTGGTTGALNMEYGVPKLAMFKEYKKGAPKGVMSLIQLDKISPIEILVGIQLLQSQINFVFELNTKKDLDLKDLLEEVIEKKKNTIKEKTLYLTRSNLKDDIDSEEEMKKIYKHKLEFTTEDRIQQAIVDQKEDVVYAKVMNYRNLKFVLFINAKNSELLYGRVMTGFNQAQIGPKFFKDINE
ncbi:hypothetical protein [Flavobacterium sp.]|uniref:hypothetical protein n=1 Tax=Flavobacterium sp. TaxID=239 RepID=UPI002486E11E|nr:hypothetical protein [Flavobacterium sp.]MDI1316807.1 hypothetical protein [Flavobacterium sp.]